MEKTRRPKKRREPIVMVPKPYREGTNVEGFVNNCTERDFDDPLVIERPNGIIVAATSEAFSQIKGIQENQDALAVAQEGNGGAVMDGYGSGKHSRLAAHILGNHMLGAIESGDDFTAAQHAASAEMKQRGCKESGACYIAYRLSPLDANTQLLEIAQAGDVRLTLVYPNGDTWSTADESEGNHLQNTVSDDNAGKTTPYIINIPPGTRIIVASDGLWKNLMQQQWENAIRQKDPRKAVHDLKEMALDSMMNFDPSKPKTVTADNLTILIHDVR